MDTKTRFMREAIQASLEGMRANEGGPFGAIIVRDAKIIGRGNNKVTSSNDPTAHAEIVAIRDACQSLGSFQLAGCEIYTSCEPCPMCMAAIYWARPDRVYYANTRHDAASIGFDDSLIYTELQLDISERKIPMIQMGLEEASEVFKAWSLKEDKIRY